MSADDTQRRRTPWSRALAAALLAALVLAAHAPLFGLDRLHVQDMYVDQAGYITTARVLADTGRLQNGIVLPALVEREHYHVHMPGHSATLALSYLVLGFGVLSTLLPSLVAYCLATAGVLLIADRLYGGDTQGGRWAGPLAAALFALFSANVVYAFTAMAELTFTCACVVATAVFVHLPERRRALAPCLLLVVPFLFRESGAFLIVPLALVVLRTRGFFPAALSVGSTVLSLWLVNRWQIASGKVAASLAWVTRGGFNYGDAFAGPPPELTASEWLDALGENVERNLHLLELAFAKRPGELMPWCLLALFVAAAATLVVGVRRVRRPQRDAFPLGTGLLLLLVFSLSIALYDVKLHKMMRSAMYAYPLAAAALGGALASWVRRPGAARLALGVPLALALVAGSVTVTVLGARTLTENDARNEETTARLAWLNDRGKVIVAPNAAAQYAVESYPVIWSQQFANERTLGLLMSRYDVGVILTSRTLSRAFLEKFGLQYVTDAAGTSFYLPVVDALRLEARLQEQRRHSGDGGR